MRSPSFRALDASYHVFPQGTTTAYYCGDDIGKNNANCDGCGSKWDGKRTSPVASFAANQFGLYHMAGNVFQWVQDCYHDSYDGAPTDCSAWISGDCSGRVLRGGDWVNYPQFLRSAIRGRNSTGGRNSRYRLPCREDACYPLKPYSLPLGVQGKALVGI